MFVTMISVGVIVAKFRYDWAHHTDAGKILIDSLYYQCCTANQI